MERIEHLILGGGLTGLSTAYHLGEDCAVFERLHEPGGLARSEESDGFIFDYAPHILYTADPYASELIHSLLDGNIKKQGRKAFLYHGKCDLYTKFPYQAHLYGLPAEDIIQCLSGLVEVLRNPDRPAPTNYREWIYWRFGKGIAELMMIPYAERIWTIDPALMNFSWIDRRVPEPDFEKVLRGAIQDEAALSGFNNDFWYPIDGGIESLPAALARRVADLRLNQTLTHIDPVARTVQMNGEDTYQYESLVYTLPLIHLPRFLDEIPDHVMQAIDGLQHNVIECVNIGIDRPDISPYHWVYFYEDEFITHRISFPRNFSESTCPPGTSSVCCEVASSKHKPLRVQGKDNIIKATIESLKKANILRDDDTILTAQCLTIDPAYVIYDLDYEKNVKVIHDFLLGLGIHPCGRFGDWQYYNMDHSILSGKRVADGLRAQASGG